MYFVYVLYNGKKFYIGFSRRLKNRLKSHFQGKVHTTKRMGKVDLIYYEAFVSGEDAKRREKYLKTTKGRKGLKLILRKTLYCGVV